ncbi:MAG TPA: hypothetical protein VGG44_00780 [Tepidisphaeraceae bacterium]|jgi:hypothetical protein
MNEEIEALRDSVKNAPDASDRIGAFFLLVGHLEVTWNDLLLGLESNMHEIIRNHATGTLYAALNEPSKKTDVPIMDPNEWERKIREKGYDMNAKVRDRDKKRI